MQHMRPEGQSRHVRAKEVSAWIRMVVYDPCPCSGKASLACPRLPLQHCIFVWELPPGDEISVEKARKAKAAQHRAEAAFFFLYPRVLEA